MNLRVDKAHLALDPFDHPLIQDVWRDKYRYEGEKHPTDTFRRVAHAIFPNDKSRANEIYQAMVLGIFMPGGRILAGAGTDKHVTLMNCYVNETVEDSMTGIMHALSTTALTLQQGGGIGTDFSTLRPKGARLRRTGSGSEASGPLPFMETWNATSLTVKSAGNRRGAMMATLKDTHPDLLSYIDMKHEPGVMEQFNVSILVSDRFMEAVERDETWKLYFHIPPATRAGDDPPDFLDENNVGQYVYSTHRARDIWDRIMRSTYEFSEPGVIFIDRVNRENNLYYCEQISCTNPCGEQPLPPHGCCLLSAINLSRLVLNPFTPKARVDWGTLQQVTNLAVRFMDNVIDVTKYPLPAQEAEEKNKRRIGLGISGLGDMFAQMMFRYGSKASRDLAEQVMQCIANAAYYASAALAEERGPFPAYVHEKIMQARFIQKLDNEAQEAIDKHGLRNGVLLTVAPTGTTSLVYGNTSGGLEPIFAHEQDRKVFQPDNTWKKYERVPGYAYRLYQAVHGSCRPEELPEYMAVAGQLNPIDHLLIQAAVQKWVDASVSKTINLPRDISFEDFKDVYQTAYVLECKGCTTYKPSEVRGSVLEASGSTTAVAKQTPAPTAGLAAAVNQREREAAEADMDATRLERGPGFTDRPEYLEGATYKIKWPSWNSSIYVTINHDDVGQPVEIFITSKDGRVQEWITALTIMLSAAMRRGDWVFIADELKEVQGIHDTAWVDGKFYGSVVARIGAVIEQHLIRVGLFPTPELSTDKVARIRPEETVVAARNVGSETPLGEKCPQCGAPTLVREAGCAECKSCTYYKCG